MKMILSTAHRALVKAGQKTLALILIAGVALSLSSCAGKKHVSGNSLRSVPEPVAAAEMKMLDRLNSTQVSYTWFAGSGQGKIDWDGQRMSARFNVRILRDSVIWLQFSKFGFEVGRMLITPDSAFFINRFERTYGRYKTEEFLREYKVPVDFRMFTGVFTAGAYMPPEVKAARMGNDGSIQLTGQQGVTARYWFDASALLIRSLIIDPLAREWSAEFADYKAVAGQRIPFSRFNTLMIDGKPNVFNLEYNSLEIDVPQTFPFSIPSHYEKI